MITAIETGEIATHELTPDNQDHWPETQGSWLSQAAPARDEQGAIIGAIEFAVDITERKQAEEKLQRFTEDLERQRKELEQRLHQSVNALSKIGELRDAYTAGHQKRLQSWPAP